LQRGGGSTKATARTSPRRSSPTWKCRNSCGRATLPRNLDFTEKGMQNLVEGPWRVVRHYSTASYYPFSSRTHSASSTKASRIKTATPGIDETRSSPRLHFWPTRGSRVTRWAKFSGQPDLKSFVFANCNLAHLGQSQCDTTGYASERYSELSAVPGVSWLVCSIRLRLRTTL